MPSGFIEYRPIQACANPKAQAGRHKNIFQRSLMGEAVHDYESRRAPRMSRECSMRMTAGRKSQGPGAGRFSDPAG